MIDASVITYFVATIVLIEVCESWMLVGWILNLSYADSEMNYNRKQHEARAFPVTVTV